MPEADGGWRAAVAIGRSLAASMARLVRRFLQRARLRRELERLDDRLLRDAGITREDLEAEAAKPFWHA